MMESSESDKVNVQDVLSTRIADLQIVDDLTSVDNPLPEIRTDNSIRNNTVFTNIAVELPRPECNEDATRLVLDRQMTIEEQYWDQSGVVIDKTKSKLKLQNSNRKTVKEYNIIANSKTIPRHPSFYKFDDNTTQLLETLSLKIGPYMNILGYGHDSVVIFAKYKTKPKTLIYYTDGYAVKVYKLSSDVKKNCEIYTKVKKEVKHIECIRDARYTVADLKCLYTEKNVIVMNLIGHDQETRQSVDDLTTEVCREIYPNIVEIYNWYHEAGIVHGGLSNKNIVLYYDKPSYIGWSHSVPREHPQALTKLMKDCQFVTNYFKSRGVTVKPRDELFKKITGVDKIKELQELRHKKDLKKDLWKQKQLTNPNRNSEDFSSTGRCRFK